ncbi:MAG TPA: imidazole glycerol phosphate synthase subunit HisH [Polyangiaceae bacterium]|nr:imidazole glycerol phosphate synthase subunit HisH [Polyangiaceae bacterium]
MIIGVVDYGMGNLMSVTNALTAVGAEARVLRDARGTADAGALVVPGVGAFGRGMQGLRERGFVDALEREVREKKKPMLGICLGLQLLATRGTELGDHLGLGWVPGVVHRLEGSPGLRVPHIGWNEVSGGGALFAGVPQGTSFYFVHSYHLVPDDPRHVAGTTEYGQTFVSAVEADNVLGVQFHPEKSHKFGLALLKNFVSVARRA